MLCQAIALGGRRLDCFDTVLPDLNADAGIRACCAAEAERRLRTRWRGLRHFRAYNNERPHEVFTAHDPDRRGGAGAPRAKVYVDYDDGIVSTRTDAGLLVTTTLCRS